MSWILSTRIELVFINADRTPNSINSDTFRMSISVDRTPISINTDRFEIFIHIDMTPISINSDMSKYLSTLIELQFLSTLICLNIYQR